MSKVSSLRKYLSEQDAQHYPDEKYDYTVADVFVECIQDGGCIETFKTEIGEIKFASLDGEGGCEGGGEYVSRVYSLSCEGYDTEFWKRTGSYYSYHGTDWHEDTRVVAKEVIVTQWVDV